MFGVPGCRIVRSAGEIVREYFPFPGRFAILERFKDDIESCLRLGRPVPGAMKGDKRAILIFLGELVAGIEQQSVRRQMPGKATTGSWASLPPAFLPSPPNSGPALSYVGTDRRRYRASRSSNPYAARTYIRPAIPRWCGIPILGKRSDKLIASMLHDEKAIGSRVPVQSHDIPQPRGIAMLVSIRSGWARRP